MSFQYKSLFKVLIRPSPINLYNFKFFDRNYGPKVITNQSSEFHVRLSAIAANIDKTA
ncbi:12378_t:CDS:2 [Rhizophagus irregularis]|nr:12378_t:CDS:2 [Rhizophagus irregularis]